jgi:methyl-accepting chemotaxis protein
MLQTISGRIIAILLSFSVLLAGGAAASHIVLKQQADDALVVNLAGRQRMLTQKMTKEAALLVNLSKANDPAQVTSQRELLQNTMRVFEMTLLALKDGGSAPLNLDMTRMRPTQATTVPEIQKALETVAATWEPFKKNLTTLIASNGQDTAAAQTIIASNMQLMDMMNAAVDLMQRDSESKVNVLVLVQSLSLALGFLLACIGIWVARATIVRPLTELAAAARSMSTGNLNVELNLEGTREVKELGASFDRMRASMVAAMGGAMGGTLPDDDL